MWSPPAGSGGISFSIEDLQGPEFSIRSLAATLTGARQSELRLDIGALSIRGRTWRNVRVHCPHVEIGKSTVSCADGRIDVGERVPIAFSYLSRARALEATVRPAAGEVWRLRANFGPREPEVDITIERGGLLRLAPWLPASMPQIKAGTASGSIGWKRDRAVAARLDIDGLDFSDPSGLHAGEKIGGKVTLDGRANGSQWRWNARVDWLAGAAFWQPLFLQGTGHVLVAEGVLDAERLEVSRGTVKHATVGDAEFDAQWDRRSDSFTRLGVRTGRLIAGELYAQLLKPYLAGTVLGESRADGGVRLDATVEQGKVEALEIRFDRFSMEDTGRRFGLFGVNGRLPWHFDKSTNADLSIEGGEVLRVPFGALRLPLEMRGLRFALDELAVPLLDGTLTVNDFRTDSGSSGWRWRFSGGITPISMARFTQSVGLPTMHGTLSAVIPEVRYDRSTLNVDGALLFKVFDGTVVARNLTLSEPFGRVPRLTVDLDARNLDLDLVTRTYSFGNITGRVDVDVAGLELQNWRPVKFDARVASAPGDYPRKISQTAVDNIAALGGAGAGAVLQRTFLRFFDQFGYEKLGLSCRLRYNTCEMAGIDDAQQGYVIVRGGGIPAISVIGYNRRVDWRELVERLKRIMQENVRAVVE